MRATPGSGLRRRLVVVALALVLAVFALLLYGAFRSASLDASSKLRAQTTLQLARARADLGSQLGQSSAELFVSGQLLAAKAVSQGRSLPAHRGSLRLVRRAGVYDLERDLVAGGGTAPLVRLHEQLSLNAPVLDALGQPKVDPQARSVLSRRGVVIAGDHALLGRRLPASGNVTIARARYSVGSSPLHGAGSLQVLVPEAPVRAELATTRWRLAGGGALVLAGLLLCLYVFGRPVWRALGELMTAADQTTVDELTGLATRRVLDVALVTELDRSRRTQKPVTLALIAPDDLDRIDGAHGQLAAEEALRAVAQAITGRLRTQDLAARTGPQEFALLLPETDAAAAAELAVSVRAAVEHVAVRYGRAIFHLTASVGAATSVAGTGPRQLAQEAVSALSRAKPSPRPA